MAPLNQKEQSELEAREARRQRKLKEKQFKKRLLLALALAIVLFALLIVLMLVMLLKARMNADVYSTAADMETPIQIEYVGEKTTTAERETIVEPEAEPEKVTPTIITTDMNSTNAIMFRPEDGKVILEQNADERMYPASMTKMMTGILAIENLDLSISHVFTYEEVSKAFSQDATRAGFTDGETASMLDVLYGAMLPSGAECCYAIASEVIEQKTGAVQWDYEEQFAQMMNDKAAELGMTGTHFANCTGLQSEDHYSTCRDMAILLEYGLKNDLFREVISAHTYRTASSPFHEEGLSLMSTMFAAMGSSLLENETSIMGGKTGFTDEAGHCLASYAKTADETEYILVTSGAYSEVNDYTNIRDAKYLYGQLPVEH